MLTMVRTVRRLFRNALLVTKVVKVIETPGNLGGDAPNLDRPATGRGHHSRQFTLLLA
jgi:hypothetical protein